MAFLPVSIFGVADKSEEEREHALRESELLVIVRVYEQFSIIRWIDVAPDSKPAASCIENPCLHVKNFSWLKFNGSKQARFLLLW